MDSLSCELELSIKELINNLISKAKIDFNKLNSDQYSKGVIIYVYKCIEKYINLDSYKKKRIWRNINFSSKAFYRIYSTGFRNNAIKQKHIKKVFSLTYLMMFTYQISIQRNSSKKFFIIKKLYNALKILSTFTSKFYFGKIIDISDLGIILKLLIIFSINNTYFDIKLNSDIINLMYLKECLNIILIIFNEKTNKIEQTFLI